MVLAHSLVLVSDTGLDQIMFGLQKDSSVPSSHQGPSLPCASQKTALSPWHAGWNPPGLTCCPAPVWGSSAAGLGMAVPAAHSCSMYYTPMFSHPYEGKDVPFEAFCSVPEGLTNKEALFLRGLCEMRIVI